LKGSSSWGVCQAVEATQDWQVMIL